MTFTVEVAGKSADRFRAYTAARIMRKPSTDDHIKRAVEGKPPLSKKARIRYDAEQIAIEGDVAGSSLTIKAKDTVITRVVLYKGAREEETVVGAVETNASGNIQIDLVEPVDPVEEGEPEIVDE